LVADAVIFKNISSSKLFLIVTAAIRSESKLLWLIIYSPMVPIWYLLVLLNLLHHR